MTQESIRHRAGGRASPRQPQGNFGRGSDHAQLCSSDDVNRELTQRGTYRDAKSEQCPATNPQPFTSGRAAQTQEEALRAKPRPKRAEPLQPDRPGRSDGPLEEKMDLTKAESASAKKLRKQSKDALDNVRDGYGR